MKYCYHVKSYEKGSASETVHNNLDEALLFVKMESKKRGRDHEFEILRVPTNESWGY